MPWIPQRHDAWLVSTPAPDRHYRWLSTKPEKLGLWLRSYADRPGYALERKATVEQTMELSVKLGLGAEMVDKALNRIMYGHNVLASIPMEEYILRQGELLGKSDDALSEARDEYRATLDALPGVTSFERSEEEHDDRRRIATREDRPVSGQAGVGTSPHLRTKPRNLAQGG